MTRARLHSIAVCVLPPVVLGVLVGLAAGLIGGIAGLVIAVVGAALIGGLTPLFIRRYIAPRQLRAVLRRMEGEGETPPPDAQPVDLPLAERYAAAMTGRDWTALDALVDPELVVVHPWSKRPYGRQRFLKAAKVTAAVYPDMRVTLEEVVADPASPDVTWVRVSETGQPRAGAPLRASWWERWTLGGDRRTIRELALGRVVYAD